jgi:hypothetical protein
MHFEHEISVLHTTTIWETCKNLAGVSQESVQCICTPSVHKYKAISIFKTNFEYQYTQLNMTYTSSTNIWSDAYFKEYSDDILLDDFQFIFSWLNC